MTKNLDVYRAQQQNYGHPLTIIVQKSEERGKITWGKSSLKIGQDTKFEMSSTYLHLHFNELIELLLDGLFEESMNSMIMRWSVEPAKRKMRDSLYLIN